MTNFFSPNLTSFFFQNKNKKEFISNEPKREKLTFFSASVNKLCEIFLISYERYSVNKP